MQTERFSVRAWGAASLLIGVAALVGCNRPVKTAPVKNAKDDAPGVTMQAVDELTMAIDALRYGGVRHLANPNDLEAGSRAIFYLNQWMAKQDVEGAEWSRDKMIDRLPVALRETPGLQNLDRASFDHNDLYHLQQTLWLRDIAQRIRRERPPAHLAQWLRGIEKSAGIRQAEQLTAAERAFDWTIRNIQLDKMHPEPKGAAATVGGSDPAANLPAVRGEPGPGYMHIPLQTLLFGHGDAWERSRVFLLLARQLGIEGVMLAIADPQSTGSSQPWLSGLVMGDEIYLFDAELGLPIPGPNGEGIATLNQVVDDPDLLQALNVEGGPEYQVSADDLKYVVALVAADPAALSLRMTLLERGQPASRRLFVATQPTKLQQKLRSLKHIGQVSLWRVPFDAIMFQNHGLGAYLQKEPAARLSYRTEVTMFQGAHPILKARDLQFQGRFTTESQRPGARDIFLENRPSDKLIDRIATSTYVRDQMGINQQLPEDPKARSEALEMFVANARRVKQTATYWLGLTYYESENYGVAVEWLGERTLEATPPSPWQPGARYNLARSYEALGKIEKATELLADDESPQRHGNLLLSQWIAKRNEAKSADGESKEPAKRAPSSENEPSSTEPAAP